jgi:hypothetical protein
MQRMHPYQYVLFSFAKRSFENEFLLCKFI